jgi:3-oxoacyl-(acyl-carrier-protein) synthase
LRREVVITALGSAGAYGCGRAALERVMAAGTPPSTAEVDRAAGYHRAHGARRALLTPLGSLMPWLPPAEARRMSPPSRLAVAATRMALAACGLEPAQLAGPGTAVVVATAFGACSFSEALLRQILLEGPESASPYLFTESVANAAAAQIAIACGARGANVTLCQREAGALLAVASGAGAVAAGRAERALVGAVDDISTLLHALLDRMGALARPNRPGACGEVGRPFDRRRGGVVAADGATVLLLETAEAASRAGREPLARVCGWGSAFDPSAPPTGWGGGAEMLGRALRRVLARDREGCGGMLREAGDSAAPSVNAAPAAAADRAAATAGIDLIVSGAAGSRAGDRLEARVLRAAWGAAPLPPVVAPKAVTGEYGGGFLAAAVLVAAGAACGPTPGFEELDPELGIVPHDGSPLAPPAALLATSLAAGGSAAWLILGKP